MRHLDSPEKSPIPTDVGTGVVFGDGLAKRHSDVINVLTNPEAHYNQLDGNTAKILLPYQEELAQPGAGATVAAMFNGHNIAVGPMTAAILKQTSLSNLEVSQYAVNDSVIASPTFIKELVTNFIAQNGERISFGANANFIKDDSGTYRMILSSDLVGNKSGIRSGLNNPEYKYQGKKVVTQGSARIEVAFENGNIEITFQDSNKPGSFGNVSSEAFGATFEGLEEIIMQITEIDNGNLKVQSELTHTDQQPQVLWLDKKAELQAKFDQQIKDTMRETSFNPDQFQLAA